MSSSFSAGVYRLEIKAVMLVFRPSFVNCCPSNLFSGSTIPPPLLPCVKSILDTHIQCIRGGGLWGFWPQTDTHLPVSPFTSKNFLYDTFCSAFYECYLSTGEAIRGKLRSICTLYRLLYSHGKSHVYSRI